MSIQHNHEESELNDIELFKAVVNKPEEGSKFLLKFQLLENKYLQPGMKESEYFLHWSGQNFRILHGDTVKGFENSFIDFFVGTEQTKEIQNKLIERLHQHVGYLLFPLVFKTKNVYNAVCILNDDHKNHDYLFFYLNKDGNPTNRKVLKIKEHTITYTFDIESMLNLQLIHTKTKFLLFVEQTMQFYELSLSPV